MCGITGIINRNGLPVDQQAIQHLNDQVKHRGPDGAGVFCAKNIGLGHRRLSIIDLTDAGHQPMSTAHLTITYNGEVYNYIELREELKSLGVTFHTDSDTEVILAAYQVWGTDCTTRFNGMWAFAIHDAQNQIVFCSRDRFGIKPFYYYLSDSIFAFGSEIKQLLDFPAARVADLNKISNYLIFGETEHFDTTFFANIKKLPASHSLIYNLKDNTINLQKYYDITIHPEYARLSEEEAKAKFLELMQSSVALRMRSDVVVGACLSGGLDSSTIVGLAASMVPAHSFQTINAKSVDKSLDESHFAAMVANHCQTQLITIEPDESDFINTVEKVVAIQEEPVMSPSVVFQYHVFKGAKAQKCIVMLDGQGGDENLLGYSYHVAPFLLSQGWKNFWKNLKIIADNSSASRRGILMHVLFSIFYKIPNLPLYIRRKHPYFSDALIQLRNGRERAERYAQFRAGPVWKWQKREMIAGSIPSLLRYEDKNSMANSIETRLPFLDFRVVEFCLSIAPTLKIKEGWSKYILRTAMGNFLPKEILWRKAKLGFNAPVEVWLNNKEFILAEIKNSAIVRKYVNLSLFDFKNKDMVWRLYNIALWEKIFNIKIA